jgi:hypothetical protein
MAPPFFALALDGGEWPAVSGTLGELQGWSTESSAPAGNWTLAVQPIAIHYTDWAIAA